MASNISGFRAIPGRDTPVQSPKPSAESSVARTPRRRGVKVDRITGVIARTLGEGSPLSPEPMTPPRPSRNTPPPSPSRFPSLEDFMRSSPSATALQQVVQRISRSASRIGSDAVVNNPLFEEEGIEAEITSINEPQVRQRQYSNLSAEAITYASGSESTSPRHSSQGLLSPLDPVIVVQPVRRRDNGVFSANFPSPHSRLREASEQADYLRPRPASEQPYYTEPRASREAVDDYEEIEGNDDPVGYTEIADDPAPSDNPANHTYEYDDLSALKK